MIDNGAALALVVFRLDGLRYGVPLASVQQVVPMLAISHLPEEPEIALGVINLRGQVIPVLDIRRRFGLPTREYTLNAQLLVVQTERRIVAFPVDEVQGVEEHRLDRVTPSQRVLPGLSQVVGIVSLENDLLFIHDVDAFLSLDEEQQLHIALGGYNRGATAR